jgi:ATP-grasp domain, R2K clade family 3
MTFAVVRSTDSSTLRAVPTLVLSHRYSSDSNALFAAALTHGWDVERLHSFRCPEGLAARGPIFYGETLLADAIAEELGIVLLEPTADWLPRLPMRHRLRDIRLLTLEQALTIQGRVFVKPTDDKCFGARVYDNGAAIEPDSSLPRDLPVLISEPVQFEIEFRFFIVERRVAAFSPYIRGGDLARSLDGDWSANELEIAEADATIRALLDDPEVDLPPAVVVDVGKMTDRGWGVVEANPAWASGLCGSDPAGVLLVLARATVARNEIEADDRRWMRSVMANVER